MENEQAPAQDFIATLYNVNDHSICPPRDIGGSRITPEQLRALGIQSPRASTDDCQ